MHLITFFFRRYIYLSWFGFMFAIVYIKYRTCEWTHLPNSFTLQNVFCLVSINLLIVMWPITTDKTATAAITATLYTFCLDLMRFSLDSKGVNRWMDWYRKMIPLVHRKVCLLFEYHLYCTIPVHYETIRYAGTRICV